MQEKEVDRKLIKKLEEITLSKSRKKQYVFIAEIIFGEKEKNKSKIKNYFSKNKNIEIKTIDIQKEDFFKFSSDIKFDIIIFSEIFNKFSSEKHDNLFRKTSEMMEEDSYLISIDKTKKKNILTRKKNPLDQSSILETALDHDLKEIEMNNFDLSSFSVFKKLKMMYQPENLKGEIRPYTSKNILIRFIIKRFCNKLYSFIGHLDIKDVLDVGCGEGNTIEFLRKKNPELKFEGVDIMESSLENARKINPGIHFRNLDIFNSHYRENSFDMVLCMEVLEHLEEPEKLVERIKSISKKYCIISVPNEPFWCIANMMRLAHIKRFGNTPHHLQNWTAFGLKRFLKEHFSDVRIKTSSVWTIALCKK